MRSTGRPRAVRWSATHVMIKLQGRDSLNLQYLWLHSRDGQRNTGRA